MKAQGVAISHPRDISIGPNQYDRWRADRTKRGKLPHAIVCGVDQLDSIGPRRDVQAAWLTEVEQQRPGRAK